MFFAAAIGFINNCALTNAGLLFEMLRSTRKNSKSAWKVSFSIEHFTNIRNGFLKLPLYYEVLTLKFHVVNLLYLFLTIANCLTVDVIICFCPSFMHISMGLALSFFPYEKQFQVTCVIGLVHQDYTLSA